MSAVRPREIALPPSVISRGELKSLTGGRITTWDLRRQFGWRDGNYVSIELEKLQQQLASGEIDEHTYRLRANELFKFTSSTQGLRRWWCFIATAAYGTPMAEEIDVLRAFRDNWLMRNRFGIWFTEVYYRISPPFAGFIARHEWVRAGARFFLNPLVRLFRRLGF